jgi:O-antigen/teichoic acid export membrane protein
VTVRHHVRRARGYLQGGGLGPFLVKSVAGSGVVQGAGTIVSFLIGVQLARGLGVEGYGYYGIALAIIALASIPGEFGLPKLVTREVAAASARKDMPTLFGVIRWGDRTCWILSTIMALAVVAGTLAVGSPDSPVGSAILWGVPIIPLVALAKVRGAALQGLRHVVLGQIPVTLAKPLLFSLLIFVVFQMVPERTAATAMMLNTVAAAAALVLAHWWFRRRLPREKPDRVTQTGRRWLSSSVPLALTDGMQLLQSQVSILLLGALATAIDVGLFRIALSTATILIMPAIFISMAGMPILAELHAQKDEARLQKLVTRWAWAQTAGVLLLSLPLFVSAEPLLTLVFGSDYAPAATPLRVLLVGQVLNVAFGPNAPLLNMTGHERRVTRAMATGLVVNGIAIAILTPFFGTVGAAVGIVVGVLTWNVMAWLDGRRLLAVDTSVVPNLVPMRLSTAQPPLQSGPETD